MTIYKCSYATSTFAIFGEMFMAFMLQFWLDMLEAENCYCLVIIALKIVTYIWN